MAHFPKGSWFPPLSVSHAYLLMNRINNKSGWCKQMANPTLLIAILSEQMKENEKWSNINSKNRRKQQNGKDYRDLFKKIRDIKGIFHAKMGTIKDRNGMDLTKAKDIKKRWKEYTEELFKKELNDWDNHDAVITHLEPDILEREVKWALGSVTTNKASGSDEVLIELFQVLKYDAVKVLHSICQQIGKTQQWWQTGKGQFSFQSQRKAKSKNIQTTAQLYSSHTLAKQCSKFSKRGLNNTWTENFQMFKLDLERAERSQILNCQHLLDHRKSKREKTPTSALLTMPKPLTVWITINCGKFWKRWEYQTTLPAFWEICM